MFISSKEKQYFHDTLNDLNRKIQAQAAIHQQSIATLNEQNKRLSVRLNLLESGNNAKTAREENPKNDNDIEILRNQNIALIEDKKSLSKKLEALQERYEAETGKHLITRNRISQRKKDALTAISEIKSVKVDQQLQETA